MIPNDDLKNRIKFLKKNHAMHCFSEPLLKSIAEKCHEEIFKKNQLILEAGTIVDSCFFIISGSVCLTTNLDKELTLDRLRQGAHFGNTFLFEKKPSEFSYIAAEKTQILTIHKKEIYLLLKDYPETYQEIENFSKIYYIYSFISQLSLFQSLSTERIKEVAHKFNKKMTSPGEIIIREGQHADYFYIVQKGRFKVYRESNKDRIIAILSSGDIIGEMAIIDNKKRNATVCSITSGKLLSLLRDDFVWLLNQDEELFQSIRDLVYKRKKSLPIEKTKGDKDLNDIQKKDQFENIDLPKPAIQRSIRKKWFSRFPYIRQQSQMDCSAACLTMICSYYGTRPSLNEIKDLLDISRNGASMANLIRGAVKCGFEVRTYKSTWEQLLQAPLPAITNWKGFHWVVITKITQKHICVADPEMRILKYSRGEFEESWTRYTIFLSPTEKFKELKPSERNFKHFIPHIMKYKKMLLEMVMISVTMKFFSIFLPFLSMHLIDNVIMKLDIRLFIPSILAFSVFTFLELFLMYFRQKISLYIGQKLTLSVFSNFFNHLLSLPIHYFESRTVGDITVRIGQNATITSFIIGSSVHIFLDLSTAILISVVFFKICPLLMTLTYIIICFDIFQIYLTTPIIQRNYQEMFARLSESQSFLIETLTNLRTIKSINIGHSIRWKYESLYVNYLNTQLKGEVCSSAIAAGSGLFSSLTDTAVLFLGAYMVFDGKISIGGLVAFLSLIGFVRGPLVSIVNKWDSFQEVLNAVERVGDIYDSKPEEDIYSQDQLIDLPQLFGNIQFSNVTFRYEEDADNNILQNICLNIKAGEKIAFVGKSGSGKSTVIKLLYGFYSPNTGSISLDGFAHQDCKLSTLRKQIGIIMQNDVLFDGSIKENISRGRPSAKYEEIIKAAKSAAAHEFISNLQDGYETFLKDEASNLSGGQRQKILIARTLLQNPNILIMDEGTSALDTESERFVMDQIFENYKDKTVIIIAHRLSAIKNCDAIFVFDKGAIIESGTHDELMKKRDMYYLLKSRQSF